MLHIPFLATPFQIKSSSVRPFRGQKQVKFQPDSLIISTIIANEYYKNHKTYLIAFKTSRFIHVVNLKTDVHGEGVALKPVHLNHVFVLFCTYKKIIMSYT